MSDQQPTQPESTPETDEQEPREVHGTATIDEDKVVVVTPEGMGVAQRDPEGKPSQNPADLVEQPAKVMRIGSMIKQLLEEVRNAPLDEAGRARLADVHDRSLSELKDGLAPELVEELERISLPFSDDAPSDAELRIAQAQLVGWLEGLFHGIQTALVAQQMAAQAQLQQMRQLPPGHAPAPGQTSSPTGMPNMPGGSPVPGDSGPGEGTGQYL
ncbi:bacterial proteasome activator family protein [Knoellia sp. S7-12]|uniref:bacterial proteasome activator family protein n=1 Tax=Knoellia sp. S7-12 TaxID=3126698 RepID=UPI003366687B